MKTAKALVLDVHSRAGLETLQALGRRGVDTDVATDRKDCLAFRSRYIRRKLTQPPLSSPTLEGWFAQVRAEAYDLVVPSTETSLLALRTLAPEDPLRRAAILPSNQALDVALDKEETRKFAARLGIQTACTLLLSRNSEIPECQAYPVVLKPTHSTLLLNGRTVSVEAHIARSPGDRLAFLQRYLPHTAVQQQAYVCGQGFGVELLYSRGNPVWHFVHERIHEYPLTGGGSSYRRSIPPLGQLLEPATELLGALGWHGVAMVEFKWDRKSAPFLMEINPRLWGSLALGIDAGVDYPYGLLCLALGQPLPPQPQYRIDFYTRDLRTDLEWQKENLAANHSDPLLFTRSRARTALEMLRPLWGKESWDHFDWDDLGVTAGILRQLLKRGGALMARPAKALRDQRVLGSSRARLDVLARKRNEIDRLLFVCYGNICRSPLAERLAVLRIADKHFASAGFHPKEGRDSPEPIRRVARTLGVNLEAHSSRRIDGTLVAEAQMILVMDTENLAAVERYFPEAAERTVLLGIFLSPRRADIQDPYGASDEQTAQIAWDLNASILELRSWLCSPSPGGR
jgi:protein-tyrosine-phosphatase